MYCTLRLPTLVTVTTILKKTKLCQLLLLFFILGLFNMNFSALKCIDCFLLPPKSKKQIVSSSSAQLNLKRHGKDS